MGREVAMTIIWGLCLWVAGHEVGQDIQSNSSNKS